MNALKLAAMCGAAGMAIAALAGTAAADGYEQYSAPPPPPADEGRKFTYSFNIGATSDYVFRGISQIRQRPGHRKAASISATGSSMPASGPPASISAARRFPATVSTRRRRSTGTAASSRPGNVPHFNTTVNFDFGVIYYTYPAATDFLANLNYFEFKAGYSWSALHPSLVTGTTVFYSPDYFAETGPVWTIETFAAWTLPKVWVFTPVINGLVGWQKGDADDGYFVNIIGTDDEYYYWNAGLALTVEKITFDFRYWDTNIGGDAGGPFCAGETFCDERFVFSAKVVLP